MRLSDQPLISRKAIEARVAELASEVASHHGDGPLLMVVVLKGAAMFACDLMRKLPMPVTVEYVRASSYVGKRSSGEVDVDSLPAAGRVRGRRILLVEDILDTGYTISRLRAGLDRLKPARITLCTLLDKPSRRKTEVAADYVGFVIPDSFVVGYGLDYNEQYRQLPDVYALEDE